MRFLDISLLFPLVFGLPSIFVLPFTHLKHVSLAAYQSFRYVHLLHHKHVNDENKDPDKWTGPAPTSFFTSPLFLPFRWLTLDIGYIVFVFRNYRLAPWHVWLEFTLVSISTSCIITYFTYVNPHLFSLFLLHWVIPHRIAVGFLGFAFDWLPHYPFDGKGRWDNTTILRTSSLFEPLITFALFFQNYHLIHHLWPQVLCLNSIFIFHCLKFVLHILFFFFFFYIFSCV
jgi:beta-carotene hydroxylase